MEETPMDQQSENSENIIRSKNGNSGLWVILIVIVMLALIGGGVYWYTGQKQLVKVPTNSQVQNKPASQPSVQANNTPETPDSLDKDLDSINLGSIDSDTADLGKDLQTL